MMVFKAVPGAKLLPELAGYACWVGETGIPSSLARAKRQAEAYLPEAALEGVGTGDWLKHYVNKDLVLKPEFTLFCCVPEQLYYKLTLPVVNEYGEVAP